MANGEEVTVTGPAGMTATAKGWLTPLLFLMTVGFAVLGYASTKQHEELQNQVSRMADGIEVNNWLLSLPQDKRPRLLRPYSANRYIEQER